MTEEALKHRLYLFMCREDDDCFIVLFIEWTRHAKNALCTFMLVLSLAINWLVAWGLCLGLYFLSGSTANLGRPCI